MKRGRTIIIGLAVLCVLGGVYVGISYTKEQSAKKAEEQLQAAKTYLTDMGEVNYLSYEYEGAVLEFEKENDTWYYAADREINLKQSELESLASDMQKIEMLRTLEGGGDLAQYGLSEPSKRITARDVDGNTQTVLIGNAAGDAFYACLEGQDTAAVIAAGLQSKAHKSLEELTEEASPAEAELESETS